MAISQPAISGTITASASPPTITGHDIGTITALTPNQNFSEDNNRLDFSPGQYFTTSNSAASFTMPSFSLQMAPTRSEFNHYDPSGQNLTITVGTWTGGFFGSTTQMVQETVTLPTMANTDWLTITFTTPIALAANTSYLVRASSGGIAYRAIWASTDFGNPVPDAGWTNNSLFNSGNDRNFVADIVAVPEPGTITPLGLSQSTLAIRRRRA